MIGYKLTRPGCQNWLFCGTTTEEIVATIKNEIESEEGLSLDERDAFSIAPFEINQEEIDTMPEFPGW